MMKWTIAVTMAACLLAGIRTGTASAGQGESRLELNADRGTLTLQDVPWVRFSLPRLAGTKSPRVKTRPAQDGWHHVQLSWSLDEPVAQDELSVEFELQVEPDF